MSVFTGVEEKLRKYGYSVRHFATRDEAREYLLSSKDLGLDEALKERGNELFWHWGAEDANAARRAANAAEVYLCGANALTEKGQIVNIDGFGNRLSAMLFGPGRLYMLVGKNKLCRDLDAALDRIKNVACPLNAKRLGLKTPCGVLGRCTDCQSPDRMCKATLILDRCPGGQRIELVLVDEELGF